MPAPLSRDLRERIVEAVEGGSSMRGAAARFAVSPSSAIKLMARVHRTGSVAPARYGGHRQPLLAPHEGRAAGAGRRAAGYHAGRDPGRAAAAARHYGVPGDNPFA